MSGYETIEVDPDHGGRVVRLRLATPKANILTRRMMGELRAAARTAAEEPELTALVIEGEGKHFSFGASVEEHTRDQVASMLAEFHGLFEDLAALDVPLVALVRGQCLGGGLELAAVCDFVFAEEGARLGVPEIRLGVFPPVACALLPSRVGAARANELLLTGVPWTAREAHAAGLVTRVSEPGRLGEDFDAWVAERLLPLSASSLRFGVRAARLGWRGRFFEDLAELERLYLEELMATRDADEGITAFLEKRDPRWSHGSGPS